MMITADKSFPSPSIQSLQKEENARKRHQRLRLKELQATILFGLILGGFLLCWLPFFTLYVLSAFSLSADEWLFKVCFWLGYINSGVNPVIYALFNREYRIGIVNVLRRTWDSVWPF